MIDYTELAAFLPALKADLRVTEYEQMKVHARVEHLQHAVDGLEGLADDADCSPTQEREVSDGPE